MFVFIPFQREHFPIYQSWFDHPSIKQALGEIDEEWLEYVLTDETGQELAVFHENDLVAVIGMAYPKHTYERFTITNFAVKPGFQHQGYGSIILGAFLLLPAHKGASWVAYVDKENEAAKAFFSSNKWQKKGMVDEGMIEFEFHAFK